MHNESFIHGNQNQRNQERKRKILIGLIIMIIKQQCNFH
jgi:hypothetical protein